MTLLDLTIIKIGKPQETFVISSFYSNPAEAIETHRKLLSMLLLNKFYLSIHQCTPECKHEMR
jgi:hypothetical protein